MSDLALRPVSAVSTSYARLRQAYGGQARLRTSHDGPAARSPPIMVEPSRAVFLSYAREDADAARRIADALRACGVEVWFDQNELRGGDAWDQRIRQQIHDCVLFLPFVSGHTQTRKEGYFRREWKQAVERLEDIAEGVPFVVPICLDDTPEKSALVPRAFLQVQWTRLKKEDTPAELVKRIQHLLFVKDGAEPPAPVGAGPRAGRPPGSRGGEGATSAGSRARTATASRFPWAPSRSS